MPNFDGFWLIWYNFEFEGVLFRSDSRHNDRVDSLWECATKQAVMTVAQWHRYQIIRGSLVYLLQSPSKGPHNFTSTGPHLSLIRHCLLPQGFTITKQCLAVSWKRCSVRLFLQFFVGGLISYLRCLCLFAHNGIQHIMCCVFALSFFVLCALCCQFLCIVHF